jgi:DNA-binding Lrp family transcriptional regulator
MHIKIYLRLHNISEEKKDEFITNLKKNNVYWLSSLRGKYDLVVSIYVKNIGEFTNQYEDLIGKWGEYILDRNVAIHEKAYIFTKSYLLPNQKPEENIYGRWKEKPVILDEIDISILKYLNINARAPLIDITKKINLSTDIIRYRINNLLKKGVITGFGVKINFKKLNNHYFIISLNLQNMNKKKYSKLENLAKSNKNVIYFIKSIGDHDAELEVEIHSRDELDEILKSLRNAFVNEIKDYEIFEVTKEHKINYFPF